MGVLKFIYQASQPYRLYLLGMVFAILVVSIDANVKPYLVKLLIDKVTSPGSYDIMILVFIYGFFQVAMNSAWSFSDWCAIRYTCDFRVHIASLLIKRISQYSYHFFQNNLSGSLTAKINDAFNLIPMLVFAANYQFIQFTLTTLIALFFLAQVHTLFAVGMMGWVIVFLIITYVGMKKISPITMDCAESKSKIWGQVSDTFTNMVNVKCFAAQSYEMNRLNDVGQEFIKNARSQGYFLMKFYIIQGTIISIYAIGFVMGLIYLHAQSLVTAGDFALVFMLNVNITQKLFELSHVLREFIPNWGTVDQALKLLDLPIEIKDAPDAKPLVVHQGEITFAQVHFRYRNADPIFENKTVTILPGQKVGLVGYSGGGKTTFANLILRLFEVTSGHILIDGQDISEVTQDSLRANIGMIPQDPSLFHRSLMENIRYGRLDATDMEVFEAARKAHAGEFILALPQGYGSLVGERGVKLSGGQRQRIAIARAFLKNAPILLLDEATSQLDSVTERDIQDALWKLMQDKTTIVIAHRLSTLLHMDRLLVFDRGKIGEDGSHEELLAKGGLYKTLWDAQVNGFLPENQESDPLLDA
ncbi:MAG: ABC transporter ATP-binding protein [Candidatus Paracaedibacter sp.]